MTGRPFSMIECVFIQRNMNAIAFYRENNKNVKQAKSFFSPKICSFKLNNKFFESDRLAALHCHYRWFFLNIFL